MDRATRIWNEVGAIVIVSLITVGVLEAWSMLLSW